MKDLGRKCVAVWLTKDEFELVSKAARESHAGYGMAVATFVRTAALDRARARSQDD
ncbi:MAG: hypothetical protein ACJ8C4_00575 [Gemmataceae bacterium]